MKNILIANAVPTNNGDAALVFALRNKLIERGYDVTISTKNYKTVKRLYPEVKWMKSEDDFNILEKVLKRILPVETIINAKVKMNKKYKRFDAIISAPGGYVNSYYGFYQRFYCMSTIKKIYNTKLVMYSQSVGPLNVRDKKVLDEYINEFDLFMVRDDVSYENVKQYNNILQTNDAAFLLDKTKSIANKGNRVAISVREWGYDSRDKKKYISMMKEIAENIINQGYKVEFISTCQGIKNYVDDSKIAKEIYNEIKDEYRCNVEVNEKYLSLEELRRYINKFEFVVGTRLHMCILSIIEGIPAFNISYEVKGKECFKMLGLSKYSVDYNDDIDNTIQKLQEFINNNIELKNLYLDKSRYMNREAVKYFDYMVNNIIEA